MACLEQVRNGNPDFMERDVHIEGVLGAGNDHPDFIERDPSFLLPLYTGG